jgi:hypothetical protein
MSAVYETISTDWSEGNANKFYGKAVYGLREKAFLGAKQLARVLKMQPGMLKLKSQGNINFVRTERSELVSIAFKNDCDVCHIGVERDLRVDVNLVAILCKHFSVAYEEPLITAKLRNIGQGGALASSVAPVGIVGDEIGVSMLLSCGDQDSGLSLRAKIIDISYVAGAEEPFQIFYHLQFINVAHEDALCIQSFMLTQSRNSKVN